MRPNVLVLVDPDCARLNTGRKRASAVHVTRPNRPAEAIFRAVDALQGVFRISDPNDWKNRRELLLIDQLASVLNIPHHRRLNEISRAVDDRTASDHLAILASDVEIVASLCELHLVLQ